MKPSVRRSDFFTVKKAALSPWLSNASRREIVLRARLVAALLLAWSGALRGLVHLLIGGTLLGLVIALSLIRHRCLLPAAQAAAVEAAAAGVAGAVVVPAQAASGWDRDRPPSLPPC